MLTTLGWLALVVLILTNAVFVAGEFGFTAVDRGKVARLAERGDRRSRSVLAGVRQLSFHLSAAQLGITLCSLLLGFVAEPVVARALRPLLRAAGLPEGAAHPTALVLALVLATFAQMLFGELVPQNLALARPLAVARRIGPLLHGFARIGRPLIALFDSTANAIVRGLGVTPRQELRAARTPVELRGVIAASAAEGSLTRPTAQLLRHALSFGDKSAADVMTSRVRIVALRADATAAELLETARTSGRSRFPVYGEDLDDIIGVVHVKHAFAVPTAERTRIAVRSLAVAPVRVPESLDCDALLRRLSAGSLQIAVVIDEYGGTAGVVTVEDLVEELVGPIRDEHDEGEIAEVLVRGARHWSVSGQLHKDSLAELIGTDPVPGPFDTVAGLLLERLGRVPEVGDGVELDGWMLRVTRMDARRIDRVDVSVAERPGQGAE